MLLMSIIRIRCFMTQEFYRIYIYNAEVLSSFVFRYFIEMAQRNLLAMFKKSNDKENGFRELTALVCWAISEPATCEYFKLNKSYMTLKTYVLGTYNIGIS